MRLKDKVAIVTGGAGGIGAETARVMAREGAKVIITDLAQGGEALAKQFGAEYVSHDVADEGQWQKLIDGTIKKHGRIDVLVNSAGIEGNLAKFGGLNTTLAEWRRVMAVNLDGTFLGCRLTLPGMLERGTGSIINLASIVSTFATPTALAYGASKAGVQQLTRSIAHWGASDGKKVRCNSVHPGIIRSRMTDNIIGELSKLSNISPEQAEAMLLKGVLFGTRGTPLDVANLILFLASDESVYVTGSAFEVDGGWHMVSAG